MLLQNWWRTLVQKAWGLLSHWTRYSITTTLYWKNEMRCMITLNSYTRGCVVDSLSSQTLHLKVNIQLFIHSSMTTATFWALVAFSVSLSQGWKDRRDTRPAPTPSQPPIQRRLRVPKPLSLLLKRQGLEDNSQLNAEVKKTCIYTSALP